MDIFADVLLPLAERMGVSNIKDLPGCWEVRVDGHWYFAVNPHMEPMACSAGPLVDSGCVYVEFNGWPAGSVDLTGVGTFADGKLANLQEFAKACEAYQPEEVVTL